MYMLMAKMTTFLAGFGTLLTESTLPGWMKTLIKATKRVVNPLLIVAAVAGVVYAIWVGIKFIKADSKDEREEAKQKLIYVVIGVVVMLVLIVAFYWLAHALEKGDIKLDFWSED